ncbi:hypothetical protein [Butyrivibrio sp. MC2013]|uniref:hypothetical protein n=1 Tax=Butyrivibrio sp. MC2013 TaxID=1280686 RepID=UPI00047D1D0D|nr:hypothetical protein [Butyrivibrio sp. MC2013]
MSISIQNAITVISMIMLVYLVAGAVIDIKKRSVTGLYLGMGAAIAAVSALVRIAAGLPLPMVFFELLPGLAILFVAFVTGQKIGYGDGWMILFCGPVFGLMNVALGSCAGFFLAGAFSAVLLLLRKAGRNTRLPFLPFLAAGMGGIYVFTIF